MGKRKRRHTIRNSTGKHANMGTRNNKGRHRKRANIQRRSKKRAWVYKLRHQNTETLAGDDIRLLEMGTETTQDVRE